VQLELATCGYGILTTYVNGVVTTGSFIAGLAEPRIPTYGAVI